MIAVSLAQCAVTVTFPEGMEKVVLTLLASVSVTLPVYHPGQEHLHETI